MKTKPNVVVYRGAVYKKVANEHDGESLYLFLRNTERFMKDVIYPAFKHLLTFKNKGTFDKNEALKLLLRVTTKGAPLYMSEIVKDTKTPYYEYLNKETRLDAARDLLDLFESQYSTGEVYELVGAKNQKSAAVRVTRVYGMDEFTQAYFEAAFWSSLEEDGHSLSSNYDYSDLDDDCFARMKADCQKFQEEVLDPIREESEESLPDDEYAGHDFWLTRNGHGAGFWDGDWVEPYGTKLTDASKKFGEFALYVGDDGKIYCYPP